MGWASQVLALLPVHGLARALRCKLAASEASLCTLSSSLSLHKCTRRSCPCVYATPSCATDATRSAFAHYSAGMHQSQNLHTTTLLPALLHLSPCIPSNSEQTKCCHLAVILVMLLVAHACVGCRLPYVCDSSGDITGCRATRLKGPPLQ